MKKIFITSIVFFALLLPSVSLLYADQTPSNTNVVAIQNPLNSTYSTIPAIITGLLNIIIKIAEVACALWIIWGGFLFVKAQGNPTELEKAKSTLLYAVIGTAIILSANVILAVITTTIRSIKS